jgi:wyosine [tRNA(Phe)-imidazoG37] synthetase (radical SAM superfamily)
MLPFEREIDFDWDSEIDLSEESILEKTREICGLKEGGLGACVNPTFQSIAPALTGNPKLNPKMIFLLQNCHNLTQKCTPSLFYSKTVTT